MAEFSAADRARENARKKRIEEAIRGFLDTHTRMSRCAQCHSDIVPLDEIGKHNCKIHPFPINHEVTFRETYHGVPSKDLYQHHGCCGAHMSGALCGHHGQRRDLRSGCLRADHTTRRHLYVPKVHANRPIPIDMRRVEDTPAQFIHVEPMFVVRQLAQMRGLDLGTAEGRQALFGTRHYSIVSDHTRIGSTQKEHTIIRAGPLQFHVDIRQAYVCMLQRYGLPHRMVQQNFLRREASEQRTRRDDRVDRLQLLLNEALISAGTSASSSAMATDKIEIDGNGWVSGRSTLHTHGKVNLTQAVASIDEYYDIRCIVSDTSENQHAMDVDTTHSSSAEQIARNIVASVAASEESFTFYPFAVWTWLAENSVQDEQRAPQEGSIFDLTF